jgi:hypothetical protein
MVTPVPGSTKKAKNLSLDRDSVERGERYSQRHGTNLSRLVGDFLRALPLGELRTAQSPLVQRLRGIGTEREGDREIYRKHLRKKYGT